MDRIAKLKSRGHAHDLCLAREENKKFFFEEIKVFTAEIVHVQ